MSVRSTVSVVIPCYNGARYLQETLTSVWNQTCPPLEVIVVDDGSTDDSAAVAEKFEKPVRVIRQPNQGESTARNRGIEAARGEWVALIDADDLWKPTKLERQHELLRAAPNTICVHTAYHMFGLRNTVGEPLSEAACREKKYDVESLILTPIILPSTAMVRRDATPRFPEWTRESEDMIYFAELSLYGRFGYVPEPLVGYRAHATQQHRKPEHVTASCRSRLTWVTQRTELLGPERVRSLSDMLRKQLITDLELAKWSRSWPLYWNIRHFAESLDWGIQQPAALAERIYPPIAYRLKDALDRWRRP